MHQYRFSGSLLLTLAALLFICQPSYSQYRDKLIPVNFQHSRFPSAMEVVLKKWHLTLVALPEIFTNAGEITYRKKNASLDEVLRYMFKDLDVDYHIDPNAGTLHVFSNDHHPQAPDSTVASAVINVEGLVINEAHEPVCAVSITVKDSKAGTVTNDYGRFSLLTRSQSSVLVATSMGYYPASVNLRNKNRVTIKLIRKFNNLEAVLTPYTRVPLKQNTGNIAKVPIHSMNLPLVSSVTAALYGQVTGLLVSPMNGIPGSSSRVQLRGQSSPGLLAGWANLPPGNPLFIIDGVPLATGNDPISLLKSAAGNPNASGAAAGGIGALDFLNMQDVESIMVLKDADATAIYGSRGANGVIVITTRRGRTCKPKYGIDVFSGMGNLINTTPLLDTRQYVALRRAALTNDGITPNSVNAPDVTVWDTSRYTNFKKMLVGGTSRINGAHLSLAGGEPRFTYYISGSLRRETTVFSDDLSYIQRHFNASFSVTPKGSKFNAGIALLLSSNTSNLVSGDMTPGTLLAPNAPALRDTAGKLVWSYKGVHFTNPLSWLLNRYTANVSTIISSVHLSDTLLKNLVIKLGLGVNIIDNTETSIFPIAAQDSAISRLGSSNFATNGWKSWMAEPQLEWLIKRNKWKITLMAGSSFQAINNNRNIINATGYTIDALLLSQDAAASTSTSNTSSQYKYTAVFGSANFACDNKLYLNLTGRRDGSSRFGPDKRFGNFGAAGASWIFCNDTFHTNKAPLLSFGKLRSSYGITGNDQIGNYMYLESWTALPSSRNYGGVGGLNQDRIANSTFGWEINRKFDFSLYLEFRHTLKMEATVYRNRSTHLLISQVLAGQTGFSVQSNKNSDAVIQNSGFECMLYMDQLVANQVTLGWALRLTVPRNKLLSFPALSASNYANSLVVGQSLTVQRGLVSKGVNPSTGLMEMKDINNDGRISAPEDYAINGNADPKYYGSFSGSVKWKGLQLDVMVEGRKQPGLSPLSFAYNNLAPGKFDDHLLTNQMADVLNYWQKPGDKATVQRPTTQASTAAGAQATAALNNIKNSDLQFTDASFLRLKTITLSYSLPDAWLKKMRLGECKFYAEAQNLLTLTRYKGTDPVTRDFSSIPSLKVIAFGFHVTV